MIVVTDHAKERILLRIGCKEHKVQRLAVKAWQSKEPVNALANRKEYNSQYHGTQPRIIRQLMGRVFIFIRERGVILLLTVV